MSARRSDFDVNVEIATDLLSEAGEAKPTQARELLATAQVYALLAAVEHLANIAASLDVIAKRLEFGGGR